MTQRVLYGALALIIVFVVVWGDAAIGRSFAAQQGGMAPLLARGSLIPVFVALLAVAGAWELVHVLRIRGARPCVGIGTLTIGLAILGPWIAAGYACSSDAGARGWYATVFAMGLGMLLLAGRLVVRRRPEGALRDFGATAGLVVYLGFLPSFAVHLRAGWGEPGSMGAWLFFLVLLVTKASDIGAYFAGTLLGRHKLAESISPGKSVEGAIGGLLLSGGVCVGLLALLGDRMMKDGVADGTGTLSAKYAFVFGVLLSISGQVGDLLESCFKRDAGIKDSGNSLPRFGGILDLIDSPVLAFPTAWMILTMV